MKKWRDSMGRLIDADKLLKIVDKNYDGFAKSFTRTIINDQPTAYDVDKVVEQLLNKIFTAELYGNGWDGQTVNNLICLGDVCDILGWEGADKDE
jgi:hypothetical protein